jgi:hypothetical protein
MKLAGLYVLLVSFLFSGCERQTAPMLAYDEQNAVELRKLLQAGKKADDGSGAVSAAEPTGWGSLKGKFILNGAAPPQTPLNVDKDTAVCAPGGKVPLTETVVIGPGNGIKNVLVFVASVVPPDNPKWEHPSYAESKTGEVIFDQKNCIFLSHMAAMRATQSLKVLNSDPVGHNTNLDSKRGSAPANFLIAANGSQIYNPGLPSPAPFPVSCSIHPWMKAWLMVCGNPYFAVTKEDGTFEIANLPTGVPLEFRVWQEKVTYLQNVSVDGQPTKWSRGKFSLTLNADEVKEMNVTVDAAVFQ